MLSPPEVYERLPAAYRIFAIDVLPGLMSVGSKGGLLMPVNTGVVCRPAAKPKLEDRFLVYLEQSRWELCAMLPVCASFEPTGGLVAIAAQGDCDAECRVATDGKGSGSIGFAFSLRQHWPDPVDPDVRELIFTPSPRKVDPVVFAAKRLRRHVIEDRGRQTLRQRAAESPELAYLVDAYLMKIFYAVENAGRPGPDGKPTPVSFQCVMNFKEAQARLQKLHKAGVPKIVTESVGWNARGHDGLYPTRFPVEERPGGEQKFRDLIRFGQDLGYVMSVHDNFMLNRSNAPDWDPDLVVQDIHGEPLVHGMWAGSLEYASWPDAFPPDRLTNHLLRMKELGIQGMYYVDYMMQPLEVNYHPRHHGPRSHSARGMMRILEEARRIFGAMNGLHAPGFSRYWTISGSPRSRQHTTCASAGTATCNSRNSPAGSSPATKSSRAPSPTEHRSPPTSRSRNCSSITRRSNDPRRWPARVVQEQAEHFG
jgi:hypothetical protein